MIDRVHAREVLDSRGNPTVEAEVCLSSGVFGTAIVPSGASTGKHEAVELRDGDDAYRGKGVLKAISNVNVRIHRKLKGMDARKQSDIDAALCSLDKTTNKAKIGANATLAASLATARAVAAENGQELYEYLVKITGQKPFLPLPFANILNGGKHAEGGSAIQEFMLVPVGATSFAEATQMVVETNMALHDLVRERYGVYATRVGDEGGVAPAIRDPEEALAFIQIAIKKAGYKDKISIALDAAASEFFKDGKYNMAESVYVPEELVRYWAKLIERYGIISLEDPFDQDDTLSWNMLLHRLRIAKLPVQVVGDDLTVTNPERITMSVTEQLCNSLLLKVNQIGTLSEALDAAQKARDAGWTIMVSHRSGETEDAFIADLAVALGCGQIKIGAPVRGERTAKYNRLLRIEDYLGKKAALKAFTSPK